MQNSLRRLYPDRRVCGGRIDNPFVGVLDLMLTAIIRWQTHKAYAAGAFIFALEGVYRSTVLARFERHFNVFQPPWRAPAGSNVDGLSLFVLLAVYFKVISLVFMNKGYEHACRHERSGDLRVVDEVLGKFETLDLGHELDDQERKD